MIQIRKYVTEDEAIPIDEWLNNLKDRRAKARILIRLDRVRLGMFGDHKPVGEGVHELRISEGKGYRVYYGHTGKEVVLLLCGGNKPTQKKDIKRAQLFWQRYSEGK